jgi:hypothetical protein
MEQSIDGGSNDDLGATLGWFRKMINVRCYFSQACGFRQERHLTLCSFYETTCPICKHDEDVRASNTRPEFPPFCYFHKPSCYKSVAFPYMPLRILKRFLFVHHLEDSIEPR